MLCDAHTLIEAQKPRATLFAEDFVRKPGVNVISDVRVGVPHDTITHYARERNIDLIVIGSHARGMVNRIFFGSTSKAVLESALCPVLMVPLATMPQPESPPKATGEKNV